MLLVKALLQFVVTAFAVFIAIICLYIDVNILDNGLTEFSLTEIVQELILLAIAAMYFNRARRYEHQRQCNVLIGGFFLTMLIRELDSILDLIFHGSWLWFALAVALFSVGYAMRKPRAVVQQLTVYINTPAWGVMFSGLLAILVFSRLFGMGILWQGILHNDYQRVIKNIVEEGTELFGYVLCLAASIMYLRESRQSVSGE